MSPDSPHPSRQRRAWRALASFGCVLGAASILLSVLLFQNASRTGQALCTMRHDLELRVIASQQFLAAHPHGIAGIPASVIRNGIVNQTRTIAALHDLPCHK